MRTNGFIFLALGLATLDLAAAPRFYLPQIGPVWLKFADPRLIRTPVPLPALPAPETHEPHGDQAHPHGATHPLPPDNQPLVPPPGPLQPPAAPALSGATNSVAPPPPTETAVIGEPLIGPMMEAHQPIAPQMFLRFFRPDGSEVSREIILPAAPNFNPARPPSAPSTATYRQTKP